MLNGTSGFIYLNLNTLTFTAGDYLKADVHLKLDNPISSPSVLLHFYGLESIECSSDPSLNTTFPILSYKMPLYRWPGNSAPKGDYLFPFEIYLPPTLPTSTDVDLDDFKATVQYRLEAEANSELFTSSQIYIRSDQRFPPSRNTSSTEFDIKSCCCIRRATIALSLSIDKYAYTCNEVVRVKMGGMCNFMPQVSLKLVRQLVLHTKGRVKMKKDCLFETVTENESVDIDLKAFEDRLRIQCSAKGEIVGCSYCLSVDGVLANAFQTEQPGVSVWIVVNPPQRPSPLPGLYRSWRPVRMSGIKFHDYLDNKEDNQ
jgi:hypothetical protein